MQHLGKPAAAADAADGGEREGGPFHELSSKRAPSGDAAGAHHTVLRGPFVRSSVLKQFQCTAACGAAARRGARARARAAIEIDVKCRTSRNLT